MENLKQDKKTSNSALDKKTFFNEIQSCPQDLGKVYNTSNDSALGYSLTGLEGDLEATLNIRGDRAQEEYISIDSTLLSKVGSFKAIVPRKKRPLLTKEEHADLVKAKFSAAQSIDHHITLFRVQDKQNLGPKEIKTHTVQGPRWTPPSSLGFVFGAVNVQNRIWLATKPTGDTNGSGLLGDKGEPAILAREIMVPVKLGWSAREARINEQYGKTGRGPETVLTPPSSPVPFDSREFQNLMDVNAGWDDLPMKAVDLARVTLVPKERLEKYLLQNGLKRNDFEDALLEIVANGKILALLESGVLDLDVLSELAADLLEILLHNKKVIKLLQLEEIEFDGLVLIYGEFFDNGEEEFSSIDFEKFYKFYSSNEEVFRKLTNELDMSIGSIISLIHNYGEIVEYLTSNDAIEFLNKYANENNGEGDKVSIEWLGAIYRSNQNLFYALTIDEHNILGDLSVEDFINRYEAIQKEDEQSLEDGLLFDNDPYDILHSQVIEDYCPDEWFGSHNDSDDEEQGDDYYYSYSELSDSSEYEADTLNDVTDLHVMMGRVDIQDDSIS